MWLLLQLQLRKLPTQLGRGFAEKSQYRILLMLAVWHPHCYLLKIALM